MTSSLTCSVPYRPRVRDFAWIAALLILVACKVSLSEFISAPPPALYVQMVVDRSGSYPAAALKAALAEACLIAEQLQPGDAMRARFIGARSYSSDAVFMSVELPAASPTGGIVSPEMASQRDSLDRAIREQRRRACASLPRASKVARAGSSDVVGAVAAAAAALRTAPPRARRLLVISSDLEDNIDGGNVRIDLTNVAVRFVAIEASHGRLEDVQRNVDRWTARLSAMGASDVQLVPPGEQLDVAALRITPRDSTAR